jgi:hypothetical protein
LFAAPLDAVDYHRVHHLVVQTRWCSDAVPAIVRPENRNASLV